MFSKTEEHYYLLSSDSILRLFGVEILAIIGVLMFYLVSKSIKVKTKKNVNFKPQRFILYILFLIGLTSRLVIIRNCGGLSTIITNFSLAYHLMTKQSGYLSALSNLMVISTCLLLKHYSKNRFDKIVIGFLVILYSSTYLIFTSRTPILECLLVLVFVYNFSIKKIEFSSFLKPRMIALIVVAIFIITILPSFRTFGKTDLSIGGVFYSFKNNLSNIFDELSCVGKDSFVYDNIRINDYWWGRNYLNLFTAFIPSSMYSNKPPIDDGMYLSNLILGNVVSPSMGRADLDFQSSIPFSTQSCLFINFGLVGVFLGEFLLGILYGVVYKYLKKIRSPFSSYVYFVVIYVLELSSLSIVQALIPLALCFLVYIFCKIAWGIKHYGLAYFDVSI